MRHRKSFNHLGRKTAHRSAMLANMASSLILHKRIETTTAKAKALRSYVEPLITKSKDDTTHSRRTVFSYLQNKEAVTELFREVSAKVAERPGGYLRLLKIGSRLGDNADMCIVELVDYNEILLSESTGTKAKPARKRRGSRKKSDEPQAVAAKATSEASDTKAKISDAEVITEEKAEENEIVTQEEVVENQEEIEVKVVEDGSAQAVNTEPENTSGEDKNGADADADTPSEESDNDKK